jgi:hypothetical protein
MLKYALNAPKASARENNGFGIPIDWFIDSRWWDDD